jgi:hypothetical protein
MADARQPLAPPGDPPTVDDTSLVWDPARGQTLAVGDWIAGCVEANGRSREECIVELIRAIDRGELIVDED